MATHYHTDWVFPYWSPKLEKLARVETHLFFRWPGTWGGKGALRMAYRGGEPAYGSTPVKPDPAASLAPMALPSVESSAPPITGAELVMRDPSGKANFVLLGGGFQLALGADMRFLTPDARMSIMEIKWGLVPDMAGTPILASLVRDDILRELTSTGRIFSAQEAMSYGLATRICDDPRAAALEVAREIAGKSPDAIRAAKRMLNKLSVDPGPALIAESVEQQKLLGSANQTEAVRANMEKRAPRFAEAG